MSGSYWEERREKEEKEKEEKERKMKILKYNLYCKTCKKYRIFTMVSSSKSGNCKLECSYCCVCIWIKYDKIKGCEVEDEE